MRGKQWGLLIQANRDTLRYVEQRQQHIPDLLCTPGQVNYAFH